MTMTHLLPKNVRRFLEQHGIEGNDTEIHGNDLHIVLDDLDVAFDLRELVLDFHSCCLISHATTKQPVLLIHKLLTQ